MKLLLSAKQIPITGSTLAQIWQNYLTKDFLTARELPNHALALTEYERLRAKAKPHSSGRLIIPIGNSLYEGTRVARSYVYLHRYLIEVACGCYLPRQVKVSMADGVNLNCHPDNLILHRTSNIRCKYETARASCISCGAELPYRHRNKHCTPCGLRRIMSKLDLSIPLAKNETLQKRVKEVGAMFLDKIDGAIACGAMSEIFAYGFSPRNFVMMMMCEELGTFTNESRAYSGIDHADAYSSVSAFAYAQGITDVLEEAERRVVAATTTPQHVVLS